MRINRIIWGVVSLIVLFTLAVSFGILPSRGQERTGRKDVAATPQGVSPDNRDLSKFASVQYDAAVRAQPNEQRWFASHRYDNSPWVLASVTNPNTGAIGRTTHDPIAPPLPVAESSLILVGEVVSATAYLSNDRRSVYTEFTIKPDEVMQDTEKLGPQVVRTDRIGGVVIYPNGQRVLYYDSTLALPRLRGRYVFFLAKQAESPNYEIRAAYDVSGEKARRLEAPGGGGDESERTNTVRFLDEVRNQISLSRGAE